MNTATQDAAVARHNGSTPAPAGKPSFVSMAPQQWEMAVQLSNADIIPKDFRGKPANVFVALEMAHRLGIGPMEAMQNLYVVHGTPSMSAKFLIALANHSGRFRGGLRFESQGEGRNLVVKCYATDRETGETVEATASMAQAERAGWSKNAKYREMPEQMLSYRAATFFVRRYCPEVTMGMVTVDEAHEMPPAVETNEDPLEATLKPIEAPTEEPVEAEVYLPAERVSKLVTAFGARGVLEAEVVERLGALDAITPEKFQEALAWFKELPEPETPDAPTEMFDAPSDSKSYDPQDAAPF